ncbi:MAG: hypothetical protein NTW19_24965 [Planctomycetota bacterium]|nr:hypothetical protein [Planctomycetota bacterium]
MLTPTQIAFFKHHGYLILSGAVAPAVIDVWRESFWEAVDAKADDPESWRKRPGLKAEYKLRHEEAGLNRQPAVAEAVEQLGGGWFVGDAGPPLVHWPAGCDAWTPTRLGHVDGYPPSFWFPFMMAATAYAYDVEPMGGAFTYWPESHHSTHRRFLANPGMIDGKWAREPGFDWTGPDNFTDLAPHPPREFTARAGDVILWHAFLVHSGSMNIRNSPRVGFFSRFWHRDQEAIKYDVPKDLWKYWAA